MCVECYLLQGSMLNSIKIVCMCSWDELQAVPSMHRLCFNAATKYFMLFKKCYAFAFADAESCVVSKERTEVKNRGGGCDKHFQYYDFYFKPCTRRMPAACTYSIVHKRHQVQLQVQTRALHSTRKARTLPKEQKKKKIA